MPTLTDAAPASAGWYWKQTHWDNYTLVGPPAEMHKLRGPMYVASLDGQGPFNFRDYLSLCQFCGAHGINAQQV